MTFERYPGFPGGAEVPPGPASSGTGPATVSSPVQVRLQILSTEHWSLLASRNLAWSESFARAGMYLSTLSGSMVVLGLIAGVDGFHDAFFVFALVLLPVVLFLGIGTWVRLGAANYHDAMAVHGMNRIRGAYLEMAPDLAPYFVMGVHDDPAGIAVTMAVPPGTPEPVHLLAATPFLVLVLDAVVAGAIAAAVATRAGAEPATTLGVAAVASLGVFGGLVLLARRNIGAGQRLVRPMFPTPAGPGDADAGGR